MPNRVLNWGPSSWQSVLWPFHCFSWKFLWLWGHFPQPQKSLRATFGLRGASVANRCPRNGDWGFLGLFCVWIPFKLVLSEILLPIWAENWVLYLEFRYHCFTTKLNLLTFIYVWWTVFGLFLPYAFLVHNNFTKFLWILQSWDSRSITIHTISVVSEKGQYIFLCIEGDAVF